MEHEVLRIQTCVGEGYCKLHVSAMIRWWRGFLSLSAASSVFASLVAIGHGILSISQELRQYFLSTSESGRNGFAYPESVSHPTWCHKTATRVWSEFPYKRIGSF